MNTKHEHDTTETESIDELDTFEERWVTALRRPDPADTARDAAFVDRVLDRWQGETTRPVIAKLGAGWTPYAAAAALLFAAVVGLAVLRGQPGQDPENTATSPGNTADVVAEDTSPDTPQPPSPPHLAGLSEAERHELARSLQLGTLIAGTSGVLANPAAGLPQALDDTAANLTLQGLTRGLTSPVPDPAQVLPSREAAPRG